MESLQDWFEYVNRMSRPVRRNGENSSEPAWRPWRAEPAPPLAGPTLRAEDVPPLFDTHARAEEFRESYHRATRGFEDPTVHDEMAPLPQFSVPELSVPAFSVDVPSLKTASRRFLWERDGGSNGRAGQPSPDETAVDAEGVEELSPVRALGEPNDNPIPESQLAQITRSLTRESRDDLVDRLSDPTLSLEQAALILGVCTTTVRRYTNRGQLPHFRTQGNQRRFRLSDVMAFRDSRASEMSTDAPQDDGIE